MQYVNIEDPDKTVYKYCMIKVFALKSQLWKKENSFEEFSLFLHENM